ncbi:hypothetical protein [Nocardia sp. NPDC127526]|uniref:hypothetical protein n=1 Tax=Nocardia sp. NPDC127526 TaxID=3345393 RepID=UPI003631AD9D
MTPRRMADAAATAATRAVSAVITPRPWTVPVLATSAVLSTTAILVASAPHAAAAPALIGVHLS